MLDQVERSKLDFALSSLRMAIDLRNAGSLVAAIEYERIARRYICQVLDVEYDLARNEGNRASL